MTKSIEDLIMENKNFIYKIASKYSRYYSIDDLFQVGAIGFIKAYKKFDNSLGKFTTYAYKYVLGEIIEYIRNDRTMKVSSDILKLYKSYEKSKEYLTHELERVPTLYEISEFMNVSEEYLSDIILKSEFVISLDATLNDDGLTMENFLGEDNVNNLDSLLDLKKELSLLSEEEKRLITLRYLKDYTQTETANIMGLSQVKVSRCETKVLKKIKSNMTV